jgi:hypothetical protein
MAGDAHQALACGLLIPDVMQIAFMTLVLFFSANSFADDDDHLSLLGAFAGHAILTPSEGGQTGNFFTFGGRISTGVRGPRAVYSFGVAANTLKDSVRVGSLTAEERATTVCFEMLANRFLDSGFYFGTRVGVGLLNWSISSENLDVRFSATRFVVAPVLGYEFRPHPALGLGFDASWVTVSGGEINFSGLSTVQQEPTTALLLQGALNIYW